MYQAERDPYAHGVPAASTTKRIRRKPRDAEREILEAARGFLQTNDFRDLTVDEVMRRTSMRRSAFYNYFADRNALVLRLVQDVEAEMMAAAKLWLGGSDDPVASLERALDGVVQVYAEHGHVLRAIHEASYHDDDVQRYWRYGLVEDFIDLVTKRIRQDNRIGRTAIPKPREVAHALLMMNANVLAERLGRAPADRPRAVAATLKFTWVRVIYGEFAGDIGTRPAVGRRAART